MALKRIHDQVIYNADIVGELPVVVVLIGEDGDLWQLDSYDAADENALERIATSSPERIIDALKEYQKRGTDE